MNQKTNPFRGLAAEGFFPATGANDRRNPIHEYILAVDLKNFGHQFLSALLCMTGRASKHIYLRFV